MPNGLLDLNVDQCRSILWNSSQCWSLPDQGYLICYWSALICIKQYFFINAISPRKNTVCMPKTRSQAWKKYLGQTYLHYFLNRVPTVNVINAIIVVVLSYVNINSPSGSLVIPEVHTNCTACRNRTRNKSAITRTRGRWVDVCIATYESRIQIWTCVSFLKYPTGRALTVNVMS